MISHLRVPIYHVVSRHHQKAIFKIINLVEPSLVPKSVHGSIYFTQNKFKAWKPRIDSESRTNSFSRHFGSTKIELIDGKLQYSTLFCHKRLSFITYFTHELRIPYFVSYESPPDRGSMVENWYLRVNEPLGLLKRNFQTNNYFVF